VGAEIVAMAECDGQRLGCVTPRWADDGSPLGGARANDNAHVDANTQTNVNAHAGAVAQANDNAHVDADARTNHNAHVDAVAPADEGSRDANVDANLHGSAHADADPRGVTLRASARKTVRTRAKQAIPPALRRRVLLRDHRCCRVPGCRTHVFSICTISSCAPMAARTSREIC
jgi:hypothetical protein